MFGVPANTPRGGGGASSNMPSLKAVKHGFKDELASLKHYYHKVDSSVPIMYLDLKLNLLNIFLIFL